VLGVTVLATAAVLAAQVVGFVVLRSWLLNRVDDQLAGFRPPSRAVVEAVTDADDLPAQPKGALPSDFRVYFYNADGHLLGKSLGSHDKPGPRLPDSTGELTLTEGHPESVASTDGDGHWRVLLKSGPEGMKVVVALPLDTVDGATSKILWLDAVLLFVTVAAVLVVGRMVVRLGLLPLTRMERTAENITAGQLDLRLPDTNPRSEIGRLGRVLNSMLDRLQQALTERAESEGRLRRFVADAGHELRTPLTTIQGYAELTLRPGPRTAGQQREASRQIADSAARMSLLVEDLQLLATLDKEPSYAHETVDLLALAADAVSSAAVHNRSHPVDLGPLHSADGHNASGELDLAQTEGDPHRLRQVVENLLSNACTHTPDGTPVHVRVGVTRAGPDSGGTDRPGRTSASPPLPQGRWVSVIEVADEGPGLEAVHAAHVFERFYRADPSRSREHGGSGLGLAIAATIMEGHGGRLELDTAPGAGCVFRVVLPHLPPSDSYG